MDNNSRTITISAKVSAFEKMRYTAIAKSYNISLSEWMASILNIYQNSYGEPKINSLRENELLAQIDILENKIVFLTNLNEINNIKKGSDLFFAKNNFDSTI
jgi:hypothetical protein